MTAALTVERVVPADRLRVWAAWTTADGLRGWWWKHLPGTAVEVDARLGGSYRITNATAGIGVRGEFLEVEAPERFAATWVWLDDGNDGPVERIEVMLGEDPGGTRLTIVHSGPWATDEPAAAYRQGWGDTLPALDTYLSRPG